MSIYAGLDVSDKTTHVCVVDGEGAVLRREVLASDPDVIAKWLGRYCPDLVRVVLETGPLSAFLYHGIRRHRLQRDQGNNCPPRRISYGLENISFHNCKNNYATNRLHMSSATERFREN